MSSVSATDSTTSATTAATTTTSSTDKSTLNYKDFLNLLTVQLENQDPLEPTSNTDFIAQMANFSTLNTMGTLSDNFTSFSTRQQQLSSQEFLGKNVTVEPSGSDSATGTVSAVTYDSTGSIYVTINGAQYSASDITQISASN
jgi:flagellar basal-body rod modification protein FlgD